MTPVETTLRAVLEAAKGRLRHLDADKLLLEGVPVDRRRFSKATTNLLVVRTDCQDLPYLILVDDDLRYQGNDPFLAEVFAGQEQNNHWRPLVLKLRLVNDPDLAAVARTALRFLGFPGDAAGSVPLPPGLRDDWGFREAYPPLVGRETLLQEILAVLAQETEHTAMALVGSSGVGKTAVVRELAWRWLEEHADGRAFWVDTPALLAGAGHAADLRGRVHRVYDTVLHLGSSALLVLEDLHLLYADPILSLELRHAVEAGLHACGTMPPEGVAALTNPALRRRVRLLTVPEPSRSDLNRLLPPVARHLEARYGVRLSPEALRIALDRSESQPGAQPAKVIQLLDRALARARRCRVEVLGPDDVLEPPAQG